jgi:cyclophilin family peptidyl-prolyl cis-trans isomerase
MARMDRPFEEGASTIICTPAGVAGNLFRSIRMSINLIALCIIGAALLAGTAMAADPAKAGASENVVIIETNHGSIKLELYPDKAPITVKNFLAYVDDKHYDGLIFHRVIDGFMIQGGGFDKDMKQKKTKDPIQNESANGLKNDDGTIAMARTSDPDSATCQFFINTGNNNGLNKAQSQDGVGYCVFGKVTEGMDVVNKIKAVKTGTKAGMKDVPNEVVEIKSVKRAEKK